MGNTQAWKKWLFSSKPGKISLQQDIFPLCTSLFFPSRSQNFPAMSFPPCLFFSGLVIHYSYISLTKLSLFLKPEGHCWAMDLSIKSYWFQYKNLAGFNKILLVSIKSYWLRLADKWLTYCSMIVSHTLLLTSFSCRWINFKGGSAVAAILPSQMKASYCTLICS